MNQSLVGRPPLLVVAAVVATLQGLVATGLGVFVGVEALRGGAEDTPGAGLLALLGLAAGVGLVLVARGLMLRRRWGRAPCLVTQLICVPVAVTLVQSHQYVLGIALGVVAVVGAFSVMSRAVATALGEPR